MAGLVGRTLQDRYKVLRILGGGGMAAIYEGEDLVMSRPVAIKTLAPGKRYEDARRRLEREARFAAAVVHPNVCEVRDVGSLDEIGPYLVMERLTGRTLGAHIGATGALPLRDVVDIATQLLSAVEAVHALGIAHRDVKPANVFLVDRQGCGPLVKLLDFGAATEIGKPEDRPEGAVMTATGYIVGTPEYLSPEQIRGERVFRETVDVYACGVLLYEMLSGKRAFVGNELVTLFAQILHGAVQPLVQLRPDLDARVIAVVSKALDPDPARRHPSAAALQSELLAVAGTRSSAPPRSELIPVEEDDAFYEAPTRVSPMRQQAAPKPDDWNLRTEECAPPEFTVTRSVVKGT